MRGKRGIAVSAGKRAANHHTHHLLRNELPMGIVPSGSRPTYTIIFSKRIEKSTAFFKVVLHGSNSPRTTILIHFFLEKGILPPFPKISQGITGVTQPA